MRQKGFAPIIFIFVALIAVISIFYLAAKTKNTSTFPQQTATATSSPTQTIVPIKATGNGSILILKENLGIWDSNGNAIGPLANIIIQFPNNIRVETMANRTQLVTTETSTYQVNTGGSDEGLCPWEDDGSGCTYIDQELGSGAILRLWSDKNRGIFALNFQSFQVSGYYIDHFEIFNEKPTNSFSEEDILFWKKWVKEAKIVKPGI